MTEIKFVDLTEQFGEFRFSWIIKGMNWVTHYWQPHRPKTTAIPSPFFDSWERFEKEYKGNEIVGIPLADFRAVFPEDKLPPTYDKYAAIKRVRDALKRYGDGWLSYSPSVAMGFAMQLDDWIKEREAQND